MFEQLARKLKGISDKQQQYLLTSYDKYNEDSKNGRMKEMAARMLVPHGIHTGKNGAYTPESISLDMAPDKTKLEVEQFNQTQIFEWATAEIMQEMNRLTERYRPRG